MTILADRGVTILNLSLVFQKLCYLSIIIMLGNCLRNNIINMFVTL